MAQGLLYWSERMEELMQKHQKMEPGCGADRRGPDGGILGINNRTENWKTAETFLGLSKEQIAALAARLVGPDFAFRMPLRLELFWHGARDLVHGRGRKGDWEDRFAQEYQRHFSDLGSDLETYAGFRRLKDWNYDVSRATRKQGLYRNLVGTEIDIIIETPDYLLVGEAKDETSSFGTDGNYVLVHQLVRQYVMAQILVNLTFPAKGVVPFIVGSRQKLPGMKQRDQLKFMIRQGWLKKENILTWDEVDSVIRPGPGRG